MFFNLDFSRFYAICYDFSSLVNFHNFSFER